MPGGANWANVVWIQIGGGTPPSLGDADVFQIADQVHTRYTTNIAPVIADDVTLTLVKAIYYQPTGTATAQERAFTAVGGKTGPTIADQCCVALSWVIPLAYRGGKPRSYLPGVVSADLLDPAHIDPTAVTAYAAAGAAFRTAVNADTISGSHYVQSLGTVSFFTANAPRAVGLFVPYSSVKVHNRLDTMRRRLGRET
jgi:hypothetical protein